MSPSERAPASDEAEYGRYTMGGRLSVGVVVTYLLLVVVIVLLVTPRSHTLYAWVPLFLTGVTLLFLVRYLSTRYTLTDTVLVAWKVLGGRRVALEEVRAIEYASLRDLTPTGGIFGMGSWGWRGRMNSVTIGELDSVYTDAAHGLLVTAGAYPLYISPRHTDEFARELSRRVRSYTGPLPKDVGNPSGQPDRSTDPPEP